MTRNASGLAAARKGSKPGKKPASRKAIKSWDDLGDIRFGLTPEGLALVAEMNKTRTIEERLAILPEDLRDNCTCLPEMDLAKKIKPKDLLARAQNAAKLSALFSGLMLHYAPTATSGWLSKGQPEENAEGYVYFLHLDDDILGDLKKPKIINAFGGHGDIRDVIVKELDIIIDRLVQITIKVKEVELTPMT